MKAIIMAGGFGTRLRPLTCTIPKPMVPMANRPMMRHIVELLKRHGLTDIVALLFYHPAVIRNYFGDGSAFGVRMQYMHAEADFGTAGSVRNAKEKFGDERILVISGDVLTDFDIGEALRFHLERRSDATVVLTRVPNPLQFGVVISDDDGRITRFLEKPTWGEVFSDTINTGIYILESHVIDRIPYKEDYDFSKNLFPLMMEDHLRLYGYVADGYWRDVGNLHEYQEASMDILAGRVLVELDGTRHGNVYVGDGTAVDLSRASVDGTVIIGSGCRIAPTARLVNTIVGNRVTIADGAVLQNAVLWDDCSIADNAHVTESVVGSGTSVGSAATVAENVFISDRCIIGAGASLGANIKLWPEKEVGAGAVLMKSLVWEDRWMKDLFTDARITGIANAEVTPEFGAKLGAALGAVVGKGRTVLASRDPDPASRMIKRALTSGLMSAGVSVFDMQMNPIPMVRQELRNGRNAAGFHVRKSPFDRRSMDIIFFDGDGKDLSVHRTKSIERQFFSEDFPRADFGEIGRLTFPERSTESYRERFFASLDVPGIVTRAFSVVIDYSFGIASTIFPNILGDIGASVVSLHAYVDPNRLTRTAEEFRSAREHISNIVRSLGSDVGFLVDAGAEKIFVSDENGTFFEDERLLPIVTLLFLEAEKRRGRAVSAIACPVNATSEMDDVAERYGVELRRTPSTHGGMMNAVLEDHTLAFVGGTRGGFIFPEFSFATDAMYSIVKILELMAVSGKTLGTIDADIPRRAREDRRVFCPWNAKGKVMRHAMRFSESSPRRDLIDGIKILFAPHEWVLLLPDKEYEIFHVSVEADTAGRAAELSDEYEAKVVQWRDNP